MKIHSIADYVFHRDHHVSYNIRLAHIYDYLMTDIFPQLFPLGMFNSNAPFWKNSILQFIQVWWSQEVLVLQILTTLGRFCTRTFYLHTGLNLAPYNLFISNRYSHSGAIECPSSDRYRRLTTCPLLVSSPFEKLISIASVFLVDMKLQSELTDIFCTSLVVLCPSHHVNWLCNTMLFI